MNTIWADMTEGIDEGAIERAGQILKSGGLVAFPTETVYGLGGNALDPEASGKIYAAKGRPSDNPLIVHIADLRDLEPVVETVPDGGRLRRGTEREPFGKAEPDHRTACAR